MKPAPESISRRLFAVVGATVIGALVVLARIIHEFEDKRSLLCYKLDFRNRLIAKFEIPQGQGFWGNFDPGNALTFTGS